jgi:hypothetical protein
MIRLLCFFLSATTAFSQTNPIITSWLQNTTIVGSYYQKNNSTAISNNIIVNVQKVQYSTTSVYINTNGIPAYPTGPFLDGNPSQAQSQNTIFKFPLNPQQNTGNPTATTGGNIGIFINGVALFDYRDGVSWKTSQNRLLGGPLGGQGDNVWNRDAIVAERIGFDCAKGHPAMGNYHHHQNPSAFKLDKTVISTICSLYDSDGLYTINANVHSPLIGFAYDGFPIYGAYGYKNKDGSGGIVRMKSSYQLRNISVRTHYADGTDVLDGPAVNSSYPLGYFREDYVYVSHSESDYLDDHNGRFCVTPEYPNGIYAYFSTVDDNWNSAYPYVVGPTFYGIKTATKVPSISEPTTVYTIPNPTLDISPPSITIAPAALSVNIQVTSNTAWNVSSNQAWAIPSILNGTGNTVVGIQCAENKGIGSRNATITFSANGLPAKTAFITQRDSIITLSLNKQSVLFPAYASTDSAVSISSNANWTITTSDPWIHCSPMEGSGNASIIINADVHTDTVKRYGSVSVQAGNSIIKTIAITQLDSVHVPSVMAADIDTIFLNAGKNSSYSFKLVSNTPWKVISPATWLNIQPDSGNTTQMIMVTAKENISSPRKSVILIKGINVKDIMIPVIQKDSIKLSLTLSADTLYVPAKEKDHFIILTSNTPWKCLTYDSWIHIKNDTGNSSSLLSFTTTLNDSKSKRLGTIHVQGLSVPQQSLTIIQSDTVLTPSNISESAIDDVVSLFPNPANDLLVIQAKSLIRESLTLKLFDMMGREIDTTMLYQGSTIAFFDVSTLYDGTYQLSIIGREYNLQQTIIIQHQ